MNRNETMIRNLAGDVENVNAYYIGKCTGDGAVYIASLLEMLVITSMTPEEAWRALPMQKGT